MRWAFFLLLFVNVVFLIWHQWPQSDDEPVAVTASNSSSGNKSIRLLHEVENVPKSTAETAEPGTAPTTRRREFPRVPINDSSTATSLAESSRVPVVEPPPPLTEIEKKVMAAEARQAERIEANRAARKSEERAARERPRASATEAAACYTLGPFSALNNAEATFNNFTNLGLLTVLREQEVRSAQQWWVIEATQDEEAAQKRLSELLKKKVADASIITSGEYANMISLGKYSSESLATKRVNALVKLGFRPVVEKHFDSPMRYWVDVDETERPKLTAAQLKDALAGATGIEKQRRACK